MRFDRKIYFDAVRPMFGAMAQEQVDGQNALLDFFEKTNPTDFRFPAYELATTKHETASTMLPIEEYGKGQGQPYGVPDPITGQTYYGRGFVQLTWRENYAYADQQLILFSEDSLEWHPENALKPSVAANVMDRGMREGWFREGHYLSKYFNDTTEDPFNAREIINGDKNVIPDWSSGDSIGMVIVDYYNVFLKALEASVQLPKPKPLTVRVIVPKGIQVIVEEGVG